MRGDKGFALRDGIVGGVLLLGFIIGGIIYFSDGDEEDTAAVHAAAPARPAPRRSLRADGKLAVKYKVKQPNGKFKYYLALEDAEEKLYVGDAGEGRTDLTDAAKGDKVAMRYSVSPTSGDNIIELFMLVPVEPVAAPAAAPARRLHKADGVVSAKYKTKKPDGTYKYSVVLVGMEDKLFVGEVGDGTQELEELAKDDKVAIRYYISPETGENVMELLLVVPKPPAAAAGPPAAAAGPPAAGGGAPAAGGGAAGGPPARRVRPPAVAPVPPQ
jgi:hypothetical protein